MKILHTADWHLGRNLEQNSRLPEQTEFVRELETICRQENVELLLITGDIFDVYNPPAAAESLFYDALERLAGQGRRAVVVIAGNHDNPDRLEAAAPLAYRHGIFLLGYPTSDLSGLQSRHDVPDDILEAAGPGFLRIKPPGSACAASLIALPYPSEARLAEAGAGQTGEDDLQRDYSARIGQLFQRLANEHFKTETINIALSHLFVQGGWCSDSERTLQLGAAMLVDPANLPSAAQYVALGHLHRPQEVRGSAAPARYAGSPLAYSFSEAGYVKSVTLIDVEAGEAAKIRSLPLSSGKQLRRWQARDGIGQALEWAADGRDAGCWIDVEVTTDRLLTAAEIKQLREHNAGILNIRALLTGSVSEISQPADRTGRRIEELFAEFYQIKYGVKIPEDILATFVELAAGEEEA